MQARAWVEARGRVAFESSQTGEHEGVQRPAALLSLVDATGDRLDRQDGDPARLAALVESCNDAIVGESLSGVVTVWNSAAQRLFGFSARDMLGHHISAIIPHDRRNEIARIKRRVLDGDRVAAFATILRHRDHLRVKVLMTCSEIRDGDGAIVGISLIARRDPFEAASVQALDQGRTS